MDKKIKEEKHEIVEWGIRDRVGKYGKEKKGRD